MDVDPGTCTTWENHVVQFKPQTKTWLMLLVWWQDQAEEDYKLPALINCFTLL